MVLLVAAALTTIVDCVGSATDTIGDGDGFGLAEKIIGAAAVAAVLTGVVSITGTGVGGVTLTGASIVSKSSRSPLRQLSINASFVFSTGGFVLFALIVEFMHFLGFT